MHFIFFQLWYYTLSNTNVPFFSPNFYFITIFWEYPKLMHPKSSWTNFSLIYTNNYYLYFIKNIKYIHKIVPKNIYFCFVPIRQGSTKMKALILRNFQQKYTCGYQKSKDILIEIEKYNCMRNLLNIYTICFK